MQKLCCIAVLLAIFLSPKALFGADSAIMPQKMQQADAKFSETPQNPPREESIRFKTEDGWTINGLYYPALSSSWTIVMLHSQRSSLREWKLWFPQLRSSGIGYLAIDLRGHGRSLLDPLGSTTTWRRFAVSGANNEYNKMLRDVEGAIIWLSERGVQEQNIVLAGTILGANLAVKSAALHPNIAMSIAISPALNANDVLIVNPLRMAYGKRPLLLVGGSDRERQYKELILINDLARTACGVGKVTLMLEYSGLGQRLINAKNIKKVLAWLETPALPPETFLEEEEISTEIIDEQGELQGD